MVLNQFSQHCALSCFFIYLLLSFWPGYGLGGIAVPAINLVNSTISTVSPLVSANENGGQALFAGILTALLDFLVGCNLHRVALGGGVFSPGRVARNVLVFLFYPPTSLFGACLDLNSGKFSVRLIWQLFVSE